jgi:ribosome biogenesis protein BRX1
LEKNGHGDGGSASSGEEGEEGWHGAEHNEEQGGSSSDEDDSDEDDDDAAEERRAVKRQMRAAGAILPAEEMPVSHFDGSYRNKQRVLVFCSRGVTARYRHLLEDLRKLIPHHKKDVKLDCKGEDMQPLEVDQGNAGGQRMTEVAYVCVIWHDIVSSGDLQVINEIAEVKSCNNCIFLEARKRQDLYLWLSKTPVGPSVKFHVLNVHTMDELRMTGNAMLGSRPLLSFDSAFDREEAPHLQLIKALLVDAFGCPRGHPKAKPFVDRVMAFSLADGKIWVRNYQIVDPAAGDRKAKAKAKAKGEEPSSLVEIGPRFVLSPIRVFSGSFGGATLYQNPAFVSPNFARAQKKRALGGKLVQRMAAKEKGKAHRAAAVMPRDEVADVFRQSEE